MLWLSVYHLEFGIVVRPSGICDQDCRPYLVLFRPSVASHSGSTSSPDRPSHRGLAPEDPTERMPVRNDYAPLFSGNLTYAIHLFTAYHLSILFFLIIIIISLTKYGQPLETASAASVPERSTRRLSRLTKY